jgi:hypothetical protein
VLAKCFALGGVLDSKSTLHRVQSAAAQGKIKVEEFQESNAGLTSLPFVSPFSNHSTVTLRESKLMPLTTAE